MRFVDHLRVRRSKWCLIANSGGTPAKFGGGRGTIMGEKDLARVLRGAREMPRRGFDGPLGWGVGRDDESFLGFLDMSFLAFSFLAASFLAAATTRFSLISEVPETSAGAESELGHGLALGDASILGGCQSLGRGGGDVV